MVDIVLDEKEKAILRAFGKEIVLSESKIKEKGLDLAKLVILERKQVVRKIEPTGRARTIKWELTQAGNYAAAEQAVEQAITHLKPI